jgi:hypothetical protein
MAETASCKYAAFNGDDMVAMIVTRAVSAYNIRHAVETGTFRGRTTQFLAGICDTVRTVELDETIFTESRDYLTKVFANILCAHGTADEILRTKWLRTDDPEALPCDGNLLFYLDAHWYADWPLRSELTLIGSRPDVRDRALIIIDDMKTPGRAFRYYDRYKHHECSLEYLADILVNLYTNTHELVFLGQTSYPSESAAVGKLFLVPKAWGKLDEWTSPTVFNDGAFSYHFTV